MDKEFWAYISNKGQILPSTIREKEGDAKSALLKSYHYKGKEDKFELVRVEIKVIREKKV